MLDGYHLDIKVRVRVPDFYLAEKDLLVMGYFTSKIYVLFWQILFQY
jgi:hypothetical protein